MLSHEKAVTMNKSKRPVIAICYDFDGTLTPKNMQEYDFFDDLGTRAKSFWAEVDEVREKNNADQILTYMMLMIETAKARIGSDKTTRRAFQQYGENVKLFPGVEEWFGIINAYGKERGAKIEHYVVSSGIKEMIEGTSIANKFKKIYACSFVYEGGDGPAKWPAVAVNYTTKTQFLFRINKGVTDDNDNKKVNEYIPKDQRPIPFSRIIYIGDGVTDVPCMKLVKEKGGHSIAVYAQSNNDKKLEAEKLLENGRVNYVALANYEKSSKMKNLVCAIIDKIAAEARLGKIGSRTKNKKASTTVQKDKTNPV
jgi:2-hydroxy-3-keto-5-methylthiopentenyl-1-phosphate phosphatase